MRTFKKYANRKLYSHEKKGYVNLPEILEHVKKGEPILVLTHEKGQDVTDLVIREAIMRSKDVSIEALVGLVRE